MTIPDSIEIRKSKIAGVGVFARKKIRKGQTICFLDGELCSLEKMIKRILDGDEKTSDPLQVDDEKYLDLDELSRAINHSCDPNAFVRGKTELVARKDLEVGDEITYDYSTTMNDNKEKINKLGIKKLWVGQCNCGSKNCRGKIDQFKTLPEKIREFYLKNKLMPDFMLKKFK